MNEGIPAGPRTSFPAGARCAHHPEREATHTCVRCGNYMCGECISANAAGMCLACASRTNSGGSFPFNRDNYTFDSLLNYVLSRWKLNWLSLALACAAMFAAAYVPAFAGVLVGIPLSVAGSDHTFLIGVIHVVGQVLSTVLQMVGQLALFGYCLDILEHKPSGFARALERWRSVPSMMLLTLIMAGAFGVVAGIGVGLYFLVALMSSSAALTAVVIYGLLCLPGVIYASLGVTFALIDLAYDPGASALSALRTSWRLAAGRRLSIAGLMLVSGLIGLVGVLACCVGILASLPIGFMLTCSLYLALRRPGESNALPITQEWPV
jgi:uncharacterized membrane protein